MAQRRIAAPQQTAAPGLGAAPVRVTSARTTLFVCALVFALAAAVRAWTATWLTDFWGDSYHHWLITRLTMQNGGIYTDYKGLQTVWSPLYHYLSILPLVLSGRTDLLPLHGMNILLGALSCALVAYLGVRLYQNYLAAVTAGALLAFMTWHIAFSAMNVAEVFSALLVLLGILLVTAPGLRPTVSACLLALLAFSMVLTRTDLAIYLAVFVIWLWIQTRRVETLALIAGAAIGLVGWSGWSWLNTGNPLHWYQQYAQNNLSDWLTLNNGHTTWQDFSLYLNRLSPFVVPALWAGVLGITGASGAPRRSLWLVTSLLAAHTLFLIFGFARGIVPLLTERYLVMDLPLAALLMGGWVWLVANRLAAHPSTARVSLALAAALSVALILTTVQSFRGDLPELEIRRWGIDQEWQIGNFLYAQVQPGDVVLTDAPVAIYRSGKPPDQFISSESLKGLDPVRALRTRNVRWVVTQAASYDAVSAYIPRALLDAQRSGVVNGIAYELVWKYDPNKTDIQSEVWHVVEE